MATQEERFSALEQTVTVLKDDLKDINYNETMLLGLLTQQQRSIRDIKVSLVDLKESMDNRFETQQRIIEAVEQRVNSRLDTLEHRFDTLGQGINSRFEAQEKSINSRFEAQEKSINSRFEAQEKRLDEHTVLLTQILARLPEKP